MAIDGTKIIDSDLANDIYGEFMDLYDADTEITEIKKKIEKFRDGNLDDEEFEIFITAFALALWETGNLTDDIFNEVQQAISKGAGEAMWLEECSEIEAKDRQKVLGKFLKKISAPKRTPRKRRKYKKISNFIFQIDDIVTFQLSDKSYRAAILFDIFQHKGNCSYYFTPTSYIDKSKPTETNIKDNSIFVSYYGLVVYSVMHQNLSNFKERFEVIGKIKIKDVHKKVGSMKGDSSFKKFSETFQNIIDY